MRDAVIPGLVSGIQLSAGSGASGTMKPGDKHRDDNRSRAEAMIDRPELRKRSANFVPLSPVSFLARAAQFFGDRVAILGENHPNWAIAYLGILHRGAVVTPLERERRLSR